MSSGEFYSVLQPINQSAIIIIIIIIMIIIKTLFSCQVYLAGQRPTNRGHHLYHSTVDGDISHDKHTSPRAYGLTSLSEKTRRFNHLQMLKQRQHLLLNYFKTLSVGPDGNRTRASRTRDWHLTNQTNQTACVIY